MLNRLPVAPSGGQPVLHGSRGGVSFRSKLPLATRSLICSAFHLDGQAGEDLELWGSEL